MKTHLRRWFFPFIAFCWPFLFYIELVVPINNSYFVIGNDFTVVHYPYKVYFLSAINHGYFPLWSPSEAAGFPFYSNPSTQAFYPLNLPLILWYRILGGYSALDHQRFTILGVAIFALGLYAWLSQMRLNRRAVLFAVLIMSISFKIADILRFTSAVHTVAWMPWILYCITSLIYETSRRRAVLQAALLFVSLVCMFTAGYPYFVYYSALLFGPYCIPLLAPKLRVSFIGDQPVYLRRAVLLIAGSGLLALVLVAPYLIKMTGLMAQTTGRSGGDFEYATAGIFNEYTVTDTIGSFIFPPAANGEGWIYFSILGLLLIGLYLASRGGETYHSSKVKIGFLLWIACVTYITYGRESLLFRVLWEVMPGFSSLRAWPRLNIVLVFVLAWMLAISYQNYETLISKNIEHKWKPLLIVAALGVIIFLVQLGLYTNRAYDEYWFRWHVGGTNEFAFVIFTPIALIAISLFILGVHARKNTAVIFVILAFIGVIDLKGGNLVYWIWHNGVAPVQARVDYDLPTINLNSLTSLRIDPPEQAPISLTVNFSVNVVANWYFARYSTFIERTSSEVEARHEFLGVTNSDRLYFTRQIDYPTIAAFLDASLAFEYEIISYTGDDLILNVNAPVDGYLSFVDNWDPDWSASVDGMLVPIDLLFGTFKSVHITEGQHTVHFMYRPSLLTLATNMPQ